ncbi:hypothetical protein ACN28S_30235 [Cystobacter fuscus]
MHRVKQSIGPVLSALLLCATPASAQIAAAHVYHNHMPNFWAYYDLSQYASTPTGGPVRYMYDAQVINLKKNPRRTTRITCHRARPCRTMTSSPITRTTRRRAPTCTGPRASPRT